VTTPPRNRSPTFHQYDFDRPIAEQLFLYLGQVFQFNFGESQYSHRPVGVDVRQRLPATLQLTLSALLIATSLGPAWGRCSRLSQSLAGLCAALLLDNRGRDRSLPVRHHAAAALLRNSVIAAVTQIGLLLGALIAGGSLSNQSSIGRASAITRCWQS
jgi:ABC-type dipeptide/oligopeptide/nickel transport system permease component